MKTDKSLCMNTSKERKGTERRTVSLRNTGCLKPSHFMMSSKSPCEKEAETMLRPRKTIRGSGDQWKPWQDKEEALCKVNVIPRYYPLEASMATFL